MLLSGGKTCYNGPVQDLPSYFESIGYPIPHQTNPAEYILDLVSADFGADKSVQDEVEKIQTAWAQSPENSQLVNLSAELAEKGAPKVTVDEGNRPGLISITASLLHRLFIKSYRDVVAYGIRIVMYMGMSSLLKPDNKTNSGRAGNHDGNCLAAAKHRAGIYPAIYKCNCACASKLIMI